MALESPSHAPTDPQALTIRQVNLAWCERIVETLVAQGVRYSMICPGGRSAAMSMVLNEQQKIRTFTHTDERSAAFMAVGMAKTTQSPIAVCTTSGSAVANLLPAVVEAEKSRLPLVLLTCNRICADLDNEAPQVADHIRILECGVRSSLDLPPPAAGSQVLDWLEEQTNRLFLGMASEAGRGPVHLNVTLHGSYTSLDTTPLADPEAYQIPAVHEDHAESPPPPARQSSVETLTGDLGLKPGMKGLIIAGSESAPDPRQMAELAGKTGFPVLADAVSGYRRPPVTDNLVGLADLVASHPAVRELQADIIIRTGLAPCSHMIHDFLRSQNCPVIKIGSRRAFTDFMGMHCHPLPATDESIRKLGEALSGGDENWRHTWLELSKVIGTGFSAFLEHLSWGELAAANAVCNAEGFTFLHLGNSMSARHGNMFCQTRDTLQPIYGNRGVNGIDGNLGTFFGELLTREGPGLILLGDLTLIHDLPALEAAKQADLNGCICVLNNEGGGLFSIITEDVAQYDATMRNPVPINLAGIAEGFGLSYQACHSLDELGSALSDAGATPGVNLIDIQVPHGSLARDVGILSKALSG